MVLGGIAEVVRLWRGLGVKRRWWLRVDGGESVGWAVLWVGKADVQGVVSFFTTDFARFEYCGFFS